MKYPLSDNIYSIRSNNRKIGTFIIFLFYIFTFNICSAENYLFNNGKTEYSIVLGNNVSNTEKYAAKELQTYIKKIGNTDIRIINNPDLTTGKYIFIGWTSISDCPEYKDEDESYTYKTIGNNLFIFGGKDRGTLNGVYSFLEKELGLHWYTPTYTYIPNASNYRITTLNQSESPSIRLRLNLYYNAAVHMDWAAHNLLNSQWTCSKGDYGEMKAFWGCHTFSTLISPNRYFSSHPEYFSLYNGKRVNNAQLCLSSKEMRKELIKNLKEIIKDNPGYWCYDVSQNDNSNPCECKNCQALVKRYGGQSGAMIWFVNQVAKEIKRIYPDVLIGTFAYRYTRNIPTSNIRPDDNVVIRLCDIECCMAHPLEACSKNTSFINDLNGWKKISSNIYIWDYTTGFNGYLLPFPNFNALSANYRLFAKSNVIGILEEGQRESEWGEFSELKAWIISKLMWNANANVDSLARTFIKDYYGEAAPYIQQYYDLCNNQINDDTHFTIKIEGKSSFYSDDFLSQSSRIIKQALLHVQKDAETLKRTKRIAAQLYYLQTTRNFAIAKSDGSYRQLKDILTSDKTYVKEPATTLDMIVKGLDYK